MYNTSTGLLSTINVICIIQITLKCYTEVKLNMHVCFPWYFFYQNRCCFSSNPGWSRGRGGGVGVAFGNTC